MVALRDSPCLKRTHRVMSLRIHMKHGYRWSEFFLQVLPWYSYSPIEWWKRLRQYLLLIVYSLLLAPSINKINQQYCTWWVKYHVPSWTTINHQPLTIQVEPMDQPWSLVEPSAPPGAFAEHIPRRSGPLSLAAGGTLPAAPVSHIDVRCSA